MRLWAWRYVWISTVLGLNIGLISYATIFRRFGKWWRPFLSIGAAVISRNYFVSKSIDKIYYPLHETFTEEK